MFLLLSVLLLLLIRGSRVWLYYVKSCPVDVRLPTINQRKLHAHHKSFPQRLVRQVVITLYLWGPPPLFDDSRSCVLIDKRRTDNSAERLRTSSSSGFPSTGQALPRVVRAYDEATVEIVFRSVF